LWQKPAILRINQNGWVRMMITGGCRRDCRRAGQCGGGGQGRRAGRVPRYGRDGGARLSRNLVKGHDRRLPWLYFCADSPGDEDQ